MEAVKSQIKINKVAQSRIDEVNFDDIPFGRIFSDHMMIANCINGVWQEPEIKPYGKIEVSPSISSWHYGQSIFEGMKAELGNDGHPLLFRPAENYFRMNRSAHRLCMPEIPREVFMQGLKTLINLDKNWIPTTEGASLYIRPFYFSTDEYVGIRPSDNYKFIIFSCPVGAYYPKPVDLWVCRKFVRAFAGGTGEAKAAGNYSGSLIGAKLAKDNGCDQALWLDGRDRKYIEECGTMNIFFIIDGVAVTPNLDGTILDGITRDSAIKLLKDAGVPVEERKVSINEIKDAYMLGRLEDCFGTGTAATISHVNRIVDREVVLQLPPTSERSISNNLRNELNAIKKGLAEDRHEWIVKI